VSRNRISKFAVVPNEFPKLAAAMIVELMKHGIEKSEAQKRVIQALIDALNSVVSPDPNRADVNEFVVVVAHNSDKDPKIKLTHSCWMESDRATDHAKAYGIIGAFAQYQGTRLIQDHVNKDDHQRAFTDFFRNIEAHIQQLREHERQEKLGGEGKP
jgi:hypothetical protein